MLQLNTKPLYQPWNEEEFASDLYVRALSPVQRWMYRTLLQAAFFCSTRPYLPDEDTLLWMLAGCENRSQWDSNKEPVRALFEPTNIDGKQVLRQKRVVADWNRLLDKRSSLAERGRSGGLAKANPMLSSSLLSEVKGSEVEESGESEARTARSLVKDENTPARVQELAAEILQYTKRLTPDEKRELTLLGRAFPGQVVDDFRDWAASEGEGKAYPVAYYLRVANDRLRGGAATTPRQSRDNPALAPLLVEVAKISGQTPFGKSKVAAAKLLETNTPAEILGAFREHVSNMDDFGLKRSIQTFFELGGGEVLLALRRDRAEADQRTRETLARQREQMQVESEAEGRRIAAQKAEEDADWEEAMGGPITDPQEATQDGLIAPTEALVVSTPLDDDIPF